MFFYNYVCFFVRLFVLEVFFVFVFVLEVFFMFLFCFFLGGLRGGALFILFLSFF